MHACNDDTKKGSIGLSIYCTLSRYTPRKQPIILNLVSFWLRCKRVLQAELSVKGYCTIGRIAAIVSPIALQWATE